MKSSFILCLLLLFSFTLHAQETQAVNHSLIAFTIPEKDLLPENIAYDPSQKAFFVGSTRKGKIIRIDADGEQSTFVEGGQFGQWMIIGMKVDRRKNLLWVCSSGGNNLEGYEKKDETDGRPAGIFKFDLATGRLIKKYTLEQEGEIHFFNDLVIGPSGEVYITHMFAEPSVFFIAPQTDKLGIFLKSDQMPYPNGITLSDDGKYLFVAHAEGVSRISLDTKEMIRLSVPKNVDISRRESIDGLYYYKGSLVGIQSDLKTIRQFLLNSQQDGIAGQKTLESHHPMMDHPTTGVVVDDVFYSIANAQFEKVSEDGRLQPAENLFEVVVLKTELKAFEYNDSYGLLSPDKSQILFVSDRSGNDDLFLINRDGGGLRQLTFHEEKDFLPHWSPDGQQIVFTSRRDGNFEIYTIKPDGTGLKRLTNDPQIDEAPKWSPDGKKIAFFSLREGGNPDLYLVDPDGSQLERITTDEGVETFPNWSPDGRHLSFTRVHLPERNPDIHRLDLATKTWAKIYGSKGRDFATAWLDNDHLVFYGDQSGNYEIYQVDKNDQTLIQLTDDPAAESFPSPGYDDNTLLFTSDRSGQERLYWLNTKDKSVMLIRTL